MDTSCKQRAGTTEYTEVQGGNLLVAGFIETRAALRASIIDRRIHSRRWCDVECDS